MTAHHVAMWDPAADDGAGRWAALCNPAPPTRCNQGGVGFGVCVGVGVGGGVCGSVCVYM